MHTTKLRLHRITSCNYLLKSLDTELISATFVDTAMRPMPFIPHSFSDVDPFTIERGVVLGFSPTQQIWGTRYGTISDLHVAASRTLDRVYLGGTKWANGFVPQNCPSNAIDPWCMHEALLGDLCYGQLQYELTVGVENTDQSDVDIPRFYPNPASGTLNIAGLGLENARIDLTLLDALGQLVLSSNMRCAGGNAVLDLPPLAPGAYHVQLRDKLGTLVRSATIILEP